MNTDKKRQRLVSCICVYLRLQSFKEDLIYMNSRRRGAKARRKAQGDRTEKIFAPLRLCGGSCYSGFS
jgi:hypothetical protein